eukprot:TRINITY_DN13921_c0_g1_i1.p1 TRINITY_DN13921_c0_g1~~TRINITY_DN13921_c0_g1_i1.p1  ORF type:complete len:371 (-),score=65.95 TRINITY_DN13921_c0_g1_i1:63-1175(-)
MRRHGLSSQTLLLGLLAGLLTARATHYMCGSDEVQGEVQGESGLICGPRCASGTFECPNDVATGVSAEPQCMLQDSTGGYYCSLLCQLDTQCATGYTCKNLGTVGVCMRPLSFSEWSSGSRTRLFVSLPQKPGMGAGVAKAYAALQSLKKKYGISDGDADVLVVKELLMAAHGVKPAPTGVGARLGAMVSSAVGATSGLLSSVGGSTVASAPPVAGSPGSNPSLVTQIEGDLSHFAKNMQNGLPGIQQEFITDTEWNVEHGHYWTILRSLLLIGFLYLVAGGGYKYHQMGARGLEVIPHVNFWMEYPNLVKDGIAYARYVVTGASPSTYADSAKSGGFNGGLSGGIGGQSLGRTSRDTFSSGGNFEPNLL